MRNFNEDKRICDAATSGLRYARIYEDANEREAASIIAWTERRLEHVWSSGAVTMYHRQFKTMWLASFGTLDNVPQAFKDRFMALYNEMKAKEADVSATKENGAQTED